MGEGIAPGAAQSRMGLAAGIGLLVVAGLTGGAGSPRRPVAREGDTAAPDALDVQVSGCSALLASGVCEVADGAELRLWLPGVENGAIHVIAEGRELDAAVTPWPDGRTLRIRVPVGAQLLEVVVGAGPRAAVGRVPIAPAPALRPALQRARELRKAGRLDDAAAALGSADEAESGVRAAVLSARARIEYQGGHLDAAVSDFREAIGLHQEDGEISQACDDASALVFLLFERSRIAEARKVVEQEAALSAGFPEGREQVVNDEGLLAWATGDLRTAVRKGREAASRAARLGHERRRRAATLTLGLRLQELGRYTESIALFRELLASPDATACERADLLADIGWGALLAFEADPHAEVGVDPLEPLGQAMDLLRSSCPDPNHLANNLENMALAQLQRGRLVEARAALEDAKRAERDPPITVALFWLHLDGRIALAEGRTGAALSSFAREEEMAAALGTTSDRLSAAEAKASALAAMGRREDALGALQAADALMDTLAISVPLGEGMDTFFATRDRAAMRRVDLLAQLGRTDEAMTAARHWRARVLDAVAVATWLEQLGALERSLWEGAVGRYRAIRDEMEEDTAHDWALPADKLATARRRREDSSARARALLDDALSVLPRRRTIEQVPPQLAPGQLELLYVPTPSGWLGFARDAAGSKMKRLPVPTVDAAAPPAELARALLAPFDAAIGRASSIRFLPYGSARAIDLHALPWHERLLLDHAVVEYALGLGATSLEPTSTARAVVVADPAGDLPQARAEADAVSGALRRSKEWSVEDLRGPAADGEVVRAAIRSAELLHYAGHATAGGADGTASALSLAHGSRLTPEDILALPHVPRLVSLFGCDTARESATGALDALGLTTAFLAGGARVVVATSRVVDDALARDVAAEFYARFTGSPSPGPAEALRQAVLAVRERAPASDWAAFRVLVP